MSYLPIRLLAPFWKMGAKLVEMSYLWSMPHHLDGGKFNAILPDFKPSPLSHALSVAIQHKVHKNQPMVRADTPLVTN